MFSKSYYIIKYYFSFLNVSAENSSHLKEAIAWIYRAQDATPDRGVSHSYLIGKGWISSYPETTGYIIPTLLNWYRISGDEESKSRAIEMANWELTIQLEGGAVPGLSNKKPVVFDTGQVIFGWLSAYIETKNRKYLEAAIKAGDWLIENIDKDYVWRIHGNPGTDEIHVYNVRVAWALLELSRITGNERYRTYMEGFLEWALKQELHRGWFKYNCLNDNKYPLLHTIAYTAQGFLESGVILKDDRCINAAIRTSEELINHVSSNGRIPGRFDSDWKPSTRWSCLTGMAQSSIIWQRLYTITGNVKFKAASEKVNNFLKKTHDISSKNPGIRGGIKGSFPLNGAYGRYRVLNWATKFFIDALLLETYPDITSPLY